MSNTKKRGADSTDPQARKQAATAGWALGILALLTTVGIVAKVATKQPVVPTSPEPVPTVTSCSGEQPSVPLRDPGPYSAPEEAEVDTSHIFVATFKTYCGDIAFKIDPRDAPEAARSFIFLAQRRYYDGLTFDRLVQGLGVFGGTADPGYTMSAKTGKPFAIGDLVMVDTEPDSPIRIAARFAVLTRPVRTGVAGVRIGTPLDGSDAANRATLARLLQQPVDGTTPKEPLYIVHIDIQEFTRD
ncbi:MAG: peptidylprolyl isomerase [Actinomycetota bacterium]|nr:peptidylprolyl isomerase [Actinomycetota bacterium]